MKLDFHKRKIQQKYREEVGRKAEKDRFSLLINIISLVVIVIFILNLYIDWL